MNAVGDIMTARKYTLDELATRGIERFERQVKPVLRPEDDGKFVAVDVDTGDFEMDRDDYIAVMRLRSRNPEAEIWLMRAGSSVTCRIGAVR